MASWVIPLVLASVLWASHVAFIRIAIEKLPAATLTASFYVFALITTIIVLVITRTKVDVGMIVADKKLLASVILAGVTIGLTDFFFSKGLAGAAPPPIAIYSPLFTTIALTLIALIGVLVFQENLTPVRVGGFILSVVGIFLLAR